MPVGDVLNPQSLNDPVNIHLISDLDWILLDLDFWLDEFDLFVLLHFDSVADLDMVFGQLILNCEEVLLHGEFDLIAKFIMLFLHTLLGLFDFVFALELNALNFGCEHAGDVALFAVALLGLGSLVMLGGPIVRVRALFTRLD